MPSPRALWPLLVISVFDSSSQADKICGDVGISMPFNNSWTFVSEGSPNLEKDRPLLFELRWDKRALVKTKCMLTYVFDFVDLDVLETFGFPVAVGPKIGKIPVYYDLADREQVFRGRLPTTLQISFELHPEHQEPRNSAPESEGSVTTVLRSRPTFARPQMRSRDDVGRFLNAHGLVGQGVEVGVREAQYAVKILSEWRGTLSLVDPWKAYWVEHWKDDDAQEDILATARSAIAPFKTRANIIREASPQAASLFDDLSLDFIYLDAVHEYPYVKLDLEAWWPKLKVGGLFMGHDYLDSSRFNGLPFGVKSAVDEFATSVLSEVRSTSEESEETQSWYFFKNPPGCPTIQGPELMALLEHGKLPPCLSTRP